MKLLRNIFATHESRFLLLVLLAFFLMRLPSLFEPLWYGDEGIYQVLGRAMMNGRILYSGIWDNKPPLLYLIYGLVNADQFIIRLLSYFLGAISVYGVFLLSREFFSQNWIRNLTTALFAILFAIPATEANIGNAENFFLVFLICSALIIVRSTRIESREKKRKQLFFAGLLLGAAFLIKTVTLLDATAFFLFLLWISLPKNLFPRPSELSKALRQQQPLLLGFILPFIAVAIYFLLVGSLQAFISASFTNNVSYVGYKNFFLIPHGLLITKVVLLVGFTLFIFLRRTHFSQPALFIMLWFAFSFFNVFFSQRAYTHYLLVGITSFSLLIGLMLSEKKYRALSVILLCLSLFATISTFPLMKPQSVLAYYQNFLEYVTGRKSTASYHAFFDKDVPEDYAVASFLKKHLKKDASIFLWGNSAQIYTLTNTLPPGRYAVAYHITSDQAMNETQKAIDEKKPQFFVIQPDITTPQLDLSAYRYRATIGTTTIYERAL